MAFWWTDFPLFHYHHSGHNGISHRERKNQVIDNKTEKVILKFEQPYSNHNGGHIAFDSKDYFYISVGDGGSSGDPEKRAQSLNNFFGSILRIKLNNDASYTVPYDNPFLESNQMSEII